MPICPRGHESQAEDWCDFCGFPMTPPPGLAVPGAPAPGAPPFGAPGGPGGAPGYPPPPAPPGGAGEPSYGDGRGGFERPSYERPGYDPAAYGRPPYQEPGYPEHPYQESPYQGPYEEPSYERHDGGGGLGGLSIGGSPRGGSPDITAGLVTCPICRTPQTGRYCEECGYDYDLSAPPRAQAPSAPPTPPPPGRPTAPPPPPGGTGRPGGYGFPPPPGAASAPAPAPAPAPQGSPYQPSGFEKQGFDRPGPAPFGGGGRPEGFERTGPVYAEPGTGAPGSDFGTSFRLAPPGGEQQPAGPGQAPGRPPTGRPDGGPTAPPHQTRTQWIAVVSADRDYFTDMMTRSGPEASGLFFPPYSPERRVPLTGRGQLRIGRRSQQRGTVPEIDLSVPPEDPGASHQHALLAEQPDGSWVLVDQDSTNGTTMNGGAEPVPPHTAIPLNDGDRIHVGAWTTITLHRA